MATNGCKQLKTDIDGLFLVWHTVRMQKTTKFRRRVSISERIRSIPVGGQEYFPKANRNSIKTIACRIGTNSKPERDYATQEEGGGIVVFRDK